MRASHQPIPAGILPLAQLVESLSDGVIVADASGTILFTNDACDELLGYDDGELAGRPISTIVPDRLVDAHERAFRRHVTTGEARLIGRSLRLPARRADGTEVECDVVLSRHEEGDTTILVGALRQREPETASAESRIGRELLTVLSEPRARAELIPRLLQAVGTALNCQVAALWTVEQPTDQLRCEGIWSEIEADRFEAVTLGSLFPPGAGLPGRVWEHGRTEWMEEVADDVGFIRTGPAAAAGLVSGMAFPLTAASQFAGVIELYAIDRRPPSPDVITLLAGLGAVLGTFLDRARVEEERRKLLEQVQTERGRLDAVLRQMPQGVVILASNGEVVRQNGAAERLIGTHIPGETINLRRPDGTAYAPDELPVDRALSTRSVVTSDPLETISGTGEAVIVVISCAAIDDGEGRITSAVATIEDVTEARREQHRLSLLAQAGESLARSLDVDASLAEIVELAVPSLVDICIADVIDDDGRQRRAAIKATTLEIEALAIRAVDELSADHEMEAGVPQVLRTGEVLEYRDVGDDELRLAAHGDDHLEMLRRLRPAGAVIVPMIGRGETVGALTFSALPPRRPLSPADIELATELGRRAGLAVANARLYARERHVAQQLQEGLLPSLPRIDGLELAATFRPGARDLLVGGDFYDVFSTGDAGWGFVLGDVCGKGAEAAAVAGQLRYAARALARETPPEKVLSLLNESLVESGNTRFATLLQGTLAVGPSGAIVRLANAGHPSPVLLRADGSIERVRAHGALLGVFPVIDVTAIDVVLRPGDAVVMYTDGVTEAHDERGFLGDDGLNAVLRTAAGSAVQQIADAVADAAADHMGADGRDDAAVLVIRSTVEAPR